MAWNIRGRILETCSCKMVCPCWVGPAYPDQGWCSPAFVFDIQEGDSDGVKLGGCKAALVVDLPGDFFTANGTGRLYIDESTSTAQRQELEAIFTGKKGGVGDVFVQMISKWLPTQYTNIDIHEGDNPSATVGSVGHITLQPIKTEDGRQARLEDPPVGGFFGFGSIELAWGTGSRWLDPEMRPWVSGGWGEVVNFSWSAN
jgi:hypothetical protein